jgi:chromosome segregation ATPase
MVELVKSTVKCYKKKTKKTVAGERKVYEYNQYQVPLKKSDNLSCSEEVFIIPQDQFEAVIEAKQKSHQEDLNQHRGVIAEYERELNDLEWKHSELSRSYKALVSKNAKTNKRLRLEEEKITNLSGENEKLKTQLQRLYKEYQNLKETQETQTTKPEPEGPNNKKEQDIWSSIRSRLSSREDKDQEEEDQ